MKTAILLGATGLTGGHLLELLVEDKTYQKVVVLTRRSLSIQHPKIEEHCIDLLQLEKHADLIKGDVLFCCIGTTKAKTPDRKLYKQIDFGIPVEAARAAIANNVKQIQIISAPGANAKSRVFYTRTKGEMQEEILSFTTEKQQIHFLQPSLIVGNRKEKRGLEGVAKTVMSIVDFLIPLNYKIIEGRTIAKAMQVIAAKGFDKMIVSSATLQEMGR